MSKHAGPMLRIALLLLGTCGCDKGGGGGECDQAACDAQCVAEGYSGGVCSGGSCACRYGACDPATQVCAVTGKLRFEARIASLDASSQVVLDAVTVIPGIGMLAAVFDAGGAVIGQATVDAGDGSFQVPLAQGLPGGESVVFATLLTASPTDDTVIFAVLRPPSGGDPASFVAPPWAWSAPVDAGGSAGEITITEADGSGAMFIYLVNIGAMGTVLDDILGGNAAYLRTLAVMWAPGLAWSCGACYARTGAQQIAGGPLLDQSIFVGGSYAGSSAWGYVVLLHEFGHYVAANYSRDDSPGGSHTIGVPVVPPFAWSEGWASFFALSTFSRWVGEPAPLYWDIQEGSSFWINYGNATVSAGSSIRPADPSGDMLQDLDENWAGGMLWDLWDGADVAECCGDDGSALGTAAVMRAVASPRFLSADRGYPGADFVDFVDALLCAAPEQTAAVTRTLREFEGFPYDGAPGCY